MQINNREPRQSIVAFRGIVDGQEDLSVNVEFGDRGTGARPANASQTFSVEAFYGHTGEPLGWDQAHWLLCYRDYARACISSIFPRWNDKPEHFLALTAAAFISANAPVATAVVRYMERRFNEGADPDTLSRHISRTSYFGQIDHFVRCALADLQEAGSALRPPDPWRRKPDVKTVRSSLIEDME